MNRRILLIAMTVCLTAGTVSAPRARGEAGSSFEVLNPSISERFEERFEEIKKKASPEELYRLLYAMPKQRDHAFGRRTVGEFRLLVSYGKQILEVLDSGTSGELIRRIEHLAHSRRPKAASSNRQSAVHRTLTKTNPHAHVG